MSIDRILTGNVPTGHRLKTEGFGALIREFAASVPESTEYVIVPDAYVKGSPLLDGLQTAIDAAAEATRRTGEPYSVLRVEAAVELDTTPRVVISKK